MLARYGPARTAVIMNNAGGTVLFGGTADRDDLSWWTALAGQRDERVTTRDEHGRATSHSYRRVPVIAASKFRQLADHQVVAFPPGLPPAIGWGERHWLRPDVQDVTNPNAVRVRARAARRRAVTGLRAWVRTRVVVPTRAGLAGISGAARWVAVAVTRWVRSEWAALRESTARAARWLRRRPGTAPEPIPGTEPAAAEPMSAEPVVAEPAGAAVVPFSPVEWPADGLDGEPVGTGVGDWPSDNGHNGRGGWN
jgi:hypothetical protein